MNASPYINFQGKAREALAFYQAVLGGELTLHEVDGRIGLGKLVAEGATIYATDGHPNFPAQVGENMAVMLVGSDKQRMQTLFTALAEGGKEKGRMTPQPWGGETGYLADKFGINWIVRVEED